MISYKSKLGRKKNSQQVVDCKLKMGEWGWRDGGRKKNTSEWASVVQHIKLRLTSIEMYTLMHELLIFWFNKSCFCRKTTFKSEFIRKALTSLQDVYVSIKRATERKEEKELSMENENCHYKENSTKHMQYNTKINFRFFPFSSLSLWSAIFSTFCSVWCFVIFAGNKIVW